MKYILIKNFLIHILLIPFYYVSFNELSSMPKDKLDTLVLFVGLIVIAPITSNFMYTYKDVTDKKSFNFGTLTTFFSMLVVGMLFIILDILLFLMIGNVFVFRISLILFWFAVISYDVADFLDLGKKSKKL